MDAVERVLAMLGSIAGILGLVVAYQQYRIGRQRVAQPPPGVSLPAYRHSWWR